MSKHKERFYLVRWSEEDGEFVAKCDDHPSLSWLDETAEAALTGLIEMLVDVDKDEATA